MKVVVITLLMRGTRWRIGGDINRNSITEVTNRFCAIIYALCVRVFLLQVSGCCCLCFKEADLFFKKFINRIFYLKKI